MPSSPLYGKGSSVTNSTVIKHRDAHQETGTTLSGKGDDHADDAISQSTAEDDGDEDVVLSTNDDTSSDYIPPATEKNAKEPKKEIKDKASKTSAGKRSTKSVSKLEREIKSLSIGNDISAETEDSVIILPNRKLRQAATETGGPDVEYVSGKGEVDPVKKKKRYVGGK